jgi:hypothetical protein
VLRKHALSFGCLLCVYSASAIAAEVDVLRVRAAAAIAIHNATFANETATPVIDVSTKAATRPIVTMYSATWCLPCQRAKAELQTATLPFDVQVTDVSHGGQPEWCESLPAFGWPAKGKIRYVLGFPGVGQLVRSWQATQ